MAQTKTSKKTAKRRPTSQNQKKAVTPSRTNRRTKSSSGKRAEREDVDSIGGEEVTIDRRRGVRREASSAAVEKVSVAAPTLERRQKVNRRRQIDPTTCERDYTDQEVEFMNALDDYKRKSGRMFPTCSEVLEVIRSLGYAKISPADSAARLADDQAATSAKPMPENWSAVVQSAEANLDFVTSATQEAQVTG